MERQYREKYFSEPGDFRNFQLMVENKKIFVNAHSLAQISSFFASLCFNDFNEKAEQKATIGDEKYEDILEFISCIVASVIPVKHVDASNFVLITRLADKYQVKCLSKACALFIESEQFDYIEIDEPQLLAMLRSTVEFGLSKDAMIKLLERAAVLPLESLIEHGAQFWLPGHASAALFLAAGDNELGLKRTDTSATFQRQHSMFRLHCVSKCAYCDIQCYAFYCYYCGERFCDSHKRTKCDDAPVSDEESASMKKCPIGKLNMNLLG